MPYSIVKSGDKYLVKKHGKTVATCDSKKDAGTYVWKASQSDRKSSKGTRHKNN